MAAKAKKYTVNGKRVFANILALNERELKEVKRYLELGYELVEVEAEKLTKEQKHERAKANKAAREKEAKENPYSRINVEAFLKKPENKKYWDEYQSRYNEQAGTNRKRKDKKGEIVELKDEPKYLKDGNPKVKGFANCIGWFTDNFTYNAETKTYDSNAK